ncbi:KN motif and ankyrin repeat domain-containing protein 4-like isoform X2 [Phyllopteryx taeniolatus]|uniref:KN motif and ankyrin repeat domain-containing protein 4-like isoform X2 n=1 Tax=Phyllopteryx taeniolatus TaxID=161469 RepID=UPI002AD3B94A|nr:KN motif and ankyrin repeat domain-containing protein 4-like isoform X2 [Phyllopteryx taeniolatus]
MQPSKASESGTLPYSVETPYGFCLDLDFLKYVDDIEKGKTIKRIAIRRHGKGPRPSTLPRHLEPSGCGCRAGPWGSTGALGPRSRLSDEHRCGSVSPRGRAEIEAKIRAFDEQPLGERIRPHFLRASSLPLTVLLRQGLETTEEAGSLRSSRGHLEDRNKSCEDIFDGADSPHSQHCSGLLKRLRDALEHVEELEREVRVIPDLRAQICLLQEGKETLRSHIPPLSLNGTSAHYDNKRSRHEGCRQDRNPTHGWRASTDLDELLTVTSLQAKVAMLEQKLHGTELDLQRVAGRLRRQQKGSESKDERMERLTANPAVGVRAERVLIRREEDEIVALSKSVSANGESAQIRDDVEDSSTDPSVALHHINKIKRLLDEQWACLREKGAQRLSPKVIALQREMMALVDVLRSRYAIRGGGCDMTTDSSAWTVKAAEKGCKTTARDNPIGRDCAPQTAGSSEREESGSGPPREMAASQAEAQDGRRRMISQGADGGRASVEGGAAAEMAEIAKQMEGDAASGTSRDRSEGQRAKPFVFLVRLALLSPILSVLLLFFFESMTVSADFMAACHFLNDHMDNIENPTDDTRKALVVLFQDWFSAAAEENSVASKVGVYLREVKKATPSLLAFLVNLADDNGNTVLHYSVSHCKYSIVSLLLDTGVSDVNFQNKAGYTSAMLASLTAPDNPGDMGVVRRLMELGNINVRSTQTGQTALHLAVRHGRAAMVGLLLSCGADANIQDAQGTSALMFASQRGYAHIARLLLERTQCHLTLTDQSGRTALSMATQGSHGDTAALLRAHAEPRARK